MKNAIGYWDFATSLIILCCIHIHHDYDKYFICMQIIFVYVEMDNEDVGVPVANYFGITGDKPKVTFIFSLPFSPLPLFSIASCRNWTILMRMLIVRNLPFPICFCFFFRYWHTQEMMMPKNIFLMANWQWRTLRLYICMKYY